MSEALFKYCKWLKELRLFATRANPIARLRSHGGHLGLRPQSLRCILLGRGNSLGSFALLGLRPRTFYRIVEGVNSLCSFTPRFGLRPDPHLLMYVTGPSPVTAPHCCPRILVLCCCGG